MFRYYIIYIDTDACNNGILSNTVIPITFLWITFLYLTWKIFKIDFVNMKNVFYHVFNRLFVVRGLFWIEYCLKFLSLYWFSKKWNWNLSFEDHVTFSSSLAGSIFSCTLVTQYLKCIYIKKIFVNIFTLNKYNIFVNSFGKL